MGNARRQTQIANKPVRFKEIGKASERGEGSEEVPESTTARPKTVLLPAGSDEETALTTYVQVLIAGANGGELAFQFLSATIQHTRSV